MKFPQLDAALKLLERGVVALERIVVLLEKRPY